MIIADIARIPGRTFPARRWTRGLVGQAVFLPPTVFHQLTNTGEAPLHMMYIYCPGGDVAHWRQELDGTLPPAGVGPTPPLPAGAAPQCTKKPD